MLNIFKKKRQESGMVLFLVLISVIVIMIFSVTILSQSVNQTNLAHQQVAQIQEDQLAKGVFWKAFSDADSTGSMQSIQSSEAIDNTHTYNYSISPTSVGSQYQITVTTAAGTTSN